MSVESSTGFEHPTSSNNNRNSGRNRFIIAILQNCSPKCLETKNPTNVGLDVIIL